ncbi:MAG: MraY family glycosyltransferase [Candidatus Omnitrophota bacterium]
MGLSFILISSLSFSFYQGLSAEITGIIVASSIMLIFGIIDDWKELSVGNKLLVQIICTALLIFFGIRTQIVYVGNLVNLIITFIWILAITNAFNHLDVMDGLAAGCAVITSLAFFTIALLNGDVNIAILCLILSAAACGCFVYNFPPAKIYMGNAGSHFLGFTFAAVALAISYASLERKIALLSPLLILGFPIFDTAFLILMRMRKARSIFKKSDDHLALRFLHSGYSKKKTLSLVLMLSLFFSSSGVAISQISNTSGIIVVVLVAVVSIALTARMGRASADG